MLNFFRDDAYSLSEIRQSLDSVKTRTTPFIQLLVKHHDYLRESIPVLVDKIAPMDEKQRHLTRFLRLLNMHTKAEEETLYQALLAAPEREAHLEGIGGIDEHQIAFHLMGELEDLNYKSTWSEEADAKAKVLAGLIESHIKQEEQSMYPTAKRCIDALTLKDLQAQYVDKCKHYLDIEMRIPRSILTERMIQKSL
jgi:hemerythrin-like domain-containing protein